MSSNELVNKGGDIIIYQTEDGLTKIDVKFDKDTANGGTLSKFKDQCCGTYQTYLRRRRTERKLNLSEIPTGSSGGKQRGDQRNTILQPRHDYLPRLPYQISHRHALPHLGHPTTEGILD